MAAQTTSFARSIAHVSLLATASREVVYFRRAKEHDQHDDNGHGCGQAQAPQSGLAETARLGLKLPNGGETEDEQQGSYHIDDEEKGSILPYVTFAEQLHLLPRAEQDQHQVVEVVKRWLREHKGWLLILDNVEDLQLLRDFVPTPRQGAVVLTTRRAETSPLARALTVEALSDAEGTLFLLRRAGLLANDTAGEHAVPEQRVVASAIVQELGGLPLALDQAGAYLAETRCRLPDYLALLRGKQEALLKRRGSVPGEHPESVTTTFALAFERVQHKSEAASDLLRLCAYLAPEAIPLDRLSQEGANLGPGLASVASQPFALDAGLETLQANSLVRLDAESRTLLLHRLVQAVQQATLSEPEQQRWAARAVQLVSDAFPLFEVATMERYQHLLPHALLCARHIERWRFAFPEVVSLLRQAGWYLAYRAADEQVLPLLERALMLSEQVLGPDHPEIARSLYNLSECYLSQGQYERALPLLQRALAAREQILGPMHPEVAETLYNLASFYRVTGQYEQALPLYQRALTIYEHAFGPTHLDVAWCLSGLASDYRCLGQYEQALPLSQRALIIYEQAPGSIDPDVTWCLNGLSTVYRLQQQYEQALLLSQRALAIKEEAFGPDHPAVASSLTNLAELYHEQGKDEQTLPLARRALTIQKQALGPDHPEVADHRC